MPTKDENNIVTLPSVAKAQALAKQRQIEQAMIEALNADDASEDIKSFIRFSCSIGLDEGQIRMRLPGAFDACDSAEMTPDLRRLHIKRMSRSSKEDQGKV